MIKKVFLFGFLPLMLFIQQFSYCQTSDFQELTLENLTDNNAFREIIENGSQEVYDILLNPGGVKEDINLITAEDLRSNYFLQESHIQNFIAYREKYGPIKSIYELQVIEGFDREIISFFLLSISFDNRAETKKSTSIRQSVSIGTQVLLQKKEGYLSGKFLGDPFKTYLRYSFNLNNKLHLGYTGEKDPGEKYIFSTNQNKYFFDHHSAYIQFRRIGLINNLIIGDFSLQNGQGLIFSQPFSFGKGIETINAIRKRDTGLRPVSSSYEFKNFSGIAAEVHHKGLSFIGFGSYVKRDATIWTIAESGETYLKNFNKSGLHRTNNDLAKENTIRETSIGFNANWTNENQNRRFGINYLLTNFNIPFNQPETPTSSYKFKCHDNQNIGSYFDLSFPKSHVFGEVATSMNEGIGVIGGFIHQVSQTIFISTLFRNINANYHSFHGNIFSESSSQINEKGLYLGIKIYPFKNSTITLFHDTFHFPKASANISKSSSGNEWLVNFNYQKFKRLNFNFKVNYQNTERQINDRQSAFSPIQFSKRIKVEAQNILTINSSLRINNQIKWNKTEFNGEVGKGFLISMGLQYIKEAIYINALVNIFQADNYENRLYQYLPSVSHSSLYPFHFNSGSTINLLMKYQLTPNIKLNLNFNQVMFTDIKTLGNSYDLINENKKSTVSFEINLKF